MIKEKQSFETIKKFCIQHLQDHFGYAGLAEMEDKALINSGNETQIKVIIEIMGKRIQ